MSSGSSTTSSSPTRSSDVPTPTPAPSLTPSPSPSPVLVQLVEAHTSPVWLAPLLTGIFVLAAAIIALLSLWWSDQRKGKRDDQRQWDEDLKKSYLKIQKLTNALRDALWAYGEEKSGLGAVIDVVNVFTAGVKKQVDLLDLTAPATVADAAKALWQQQTVVNGLDAIRGSTPEERFEWVLAQRQQLDFLLANLRARVREALRLKL